MSDIEVVAVLIGFIVIFLYLRNRGKKRASRSVASDSAREISHLRNVIAQLSIDKHAALNRR